MDLVIEIKDGSINVKVPKGMNIVQALGVLEFAKSLLLQSNNAEVTPEPNTEVEG